MGELTRGLSDDFAFYNGGRLIRRWGNKHPIPFIFQVVAEGQCLWTISAARWWSRPA